MIGLYDYFGPWWGHPDATPSRVENASRLLSACSALELEMIQASVVFPTNPRTTSQVAGSIYGGFRPQHCPEGVPRSAHKEALAVDRYDPLGRIDAWITEHPDALERHGLYIEHPDMTPGWSHWTVRAPASGNRIFRP